jgi:hypothetical protein
MSSHDGYRDERASLVAENERLRAELARIRGPRRRASTAVALLAADVAVVLLLRPWFNGSSDAEFWTAAAVSLTVTVAAIAYAVDAFSQRS